MRCWQQLGAHGKPGFWSPSGSLLPQLTDRSEFTQAAFALHGHIWEAKAFVKENRRDFVERGRCSPRQLARGTLAPARSLQLDTFDSPDAGRSCVHWGSAAKVLEAGHRS